MPNRVDEVRQVLARRYPDYSNLPNGERVLLAMSVLANDIQVREKGANAGPWVSDILAAVGLGTGYPWCAAAIEFCCDVAGVQMGPSDRASAAVRNWHAWAKGAARLRVKPARGRLCLWLNPNGTGHIGIVAGIQEAGMVISYEGNTSSGESGSQRDGDGLYRRRRRASTWKAYIELDEPAD